MILLRELRRRAHVVVVPILGMALTGYFAYHLVEGNRGLLAWVRLTREIHVEQATLTKIEADQAQLALKAADLRPDHLDRDLLDERVRAVLDLVGPDEIVIMHPGAKQ